MQKGLKSISFKFLDIKTLVAYVVVSLFNIGTSTSIPIITKLMIDSLIAGDASQLLILTILHVYQRC